MAQHEDTFTTIEMEAALCLWEAYIDLEYSDPTFNPNVRGSVGSFTLRHAIMSITPGVEGLWGSLDEDIRDRDGWTYDFEFCPDVIRHAVDWSTLSNNGTVQLFPDARARLLARRAIEDKFAKRGK